MTAPLQAALEYAGYGFRIIPLGPRSKTPAIVTGENHSAATSDVAVISQWFEGAPDRNVGIVTGPTSNIFVVDLDGPPGLEAWDGLLERANEDPEPTAYQRTGGGGLQYFFRYPTALEVRNSAGVLGRGIDIRGVGGYVVAPPSIHPSGGAYQWEVEPSEFGIAEAPAWLLQLVVSARVSTGPFKLPEQISEGERHSKLLSLAGKLRHAGLQEDEILYALQAVNHTRCQPPCREEELRALAKSIMKYARSGQGKLVAKLPWV